MQTNMTQSFKVYLPHGGPEFVLRDPILVEVESDHLSILIKEISQDGTVRMSMDLPIQAVNDLLIAMQNIRNAM